MRSRPFFPSEDSQVLRQLPSLLFAVSAPRRGPPKMPTAGVASTLLTNPPSLQMHVWSLSVSVLLRSPFPICRLCAERRHPVPAHFHRRCRPDWADQHPPGLHPERQAKPRHQGVRIQSLPCGHHPVLPFTWVRSPFPRLLQSAPLQKPP
jgi:hypothetical protein